MFSLEINFRDGVSQPETILVRRPQALIGATEYAHVAIEDMRELNYQLRIIRDLGRRFRVKPVGTHSNVQVPDLLEGVYDGETFLDLGSITVHVTALDFDLFMRDSEPPDRAGVRVLRQVCSSAAPKFPAVVVPGSDPMVISFVPDQPVYIGRSNQCAVRLDASDISGRHARMGYESGEFWVEDLGSTNGTFVNQQQISGRENVAAGVPIILGRDVVILGVTSEDQITQASSVSAESSPRAPAQQQTYPILLSVSEVARPARLVIPPGSKLSIGRDPSSDLWLGAPHVSRKHCVVEMSKTGALQVVDNSTNGTAFDGGILRKGDILEIKNEPKVFNYGGGVTVALCFDKEQEEAFLQSQGSPHTYLSPEEVARLEQEHWVGTDFGTQAISEGQIGAALGGQRPGRLNHSRRVLASLSPGAQLLMLFLTIGAAVVLVFIVNLFLGLF